jgi:hypothetical protein
MEIFNSAEFAISILFFFQIISIYLGIRYLIIYRGGFLPKLFWFTVILTPLIGIIFFFLVASSSRKK